MQRLYGQEKDDVMCNVFVVGEAGTGKDVLIEYALKLLDRNQRVMHIHKKTDKNQLIKRRTFGEEKDKDGKYIKKTGWVRILPEIKSNIFATKN